MSQIRLTEALGAITEGRRTDHLFDVKRAAMALHVHPNKFSVWWYRNREKLLLLCRDQPGELAAEFAMIFAEAESARQASHEAPSPTRHSTPSSTSPAPTSR